MTILLQFVHFFDYFQHLNFKYLIFEHSRLNFSISYEDYGDASKHDDGELKADCALSQLALRFGALLIAINEVALELGVERQQQLPTD
jgi:hypothetical protein